MLFKLVLFCYGHVRGLSFSRYRHGHQIISFSNILRISGKSEIIVPKIWYVIYICIQYYTGPNKNGQLILSYAQIRGGGISLVIFWESLANWYKSLRISPPVSFLIILKADWFYQMNLIFPTFLEAENMEYWFLRLLFVKNC